MKVKVKETKERWQAVAQQSGKEQLN